MERNKATENIGITAETERKPPVNLRIWKWAENHVDGFDWKLICLQAV